MKETQSPRENASLEIDRRKYLRIAGGAVGGSLVAGCLDGDDVTELGDNVIQYGFGGQPYMFATESGTLAAITESEPNDACATAPAFETDTDISGTLESAGVDWYGFDLNAGEDYTVTFDRAATDGVTSVVLYDPGCTFRTLRQVGTGGQIHIDSTAETAGTHYVQVVDVKEGSGDYALRVDTGSASTATQTPTPTATPTATATPTPTATAVADEYGEQGYGEYGYGGVTN